MTKACLFSGQIGQPGETLGIAVGLSTAHSQRLVEIGQLRAQDGRLHLVHLLVMALRLVVPAEALLRTVMPSTSLTVGREHADPVCQSGVLCRAGARGSVGAEVFPRGEAEAGDVGQAAEPPAVDLRAERDTGILHERKAMAIGDAPHLAHVGGMAVHVNGQQSVCPWRDRGFASGCVDASGLRVDVDPDDGRTDRADRRYSGQFGICNRDDLVAWPDPEGAQRGCQGGRTRAHGNSVRRVDPARKFLLEARYLFAQDEVSTFKHSGDRGVDCGVVLTIELGVIVERGSHMSTFSFGRLATTSTSIVISEKLRAPTLIPVCGGR
jgi:hypothetical protein